LIFELPAGMSYNDVRVKNGSFETSDLSDAIGFGFSDLSSQETVSIAISGRADFSTLNFYVSPKLEDLNVQAQPSVGPVKLPPYGLAIFFVVLIVLLGGAVLWFVWHGYGAKREKELFKNPMDLYNLQNFISSGLAKGLPRNKIEEQLKKSGWTSGQISYAWKKMKKQEKGKEKLKKGLAGAGTAIESPYKTPYRTIKD
jgi:hypothetical protein